MQINNYMLSGYDIRIIYYLFPIANTIEKIDNKNSLRIAQAIFVYAN